MRILVLTQNENLYLPTALAGICRVRAADLACIVTAPVLGGRGGAVRGLLRHAMLFGLAGTARMAWRVAAAKLRARLHRPGPAGAFHSVPAVARTFAVPSYHVAGVNGREFHRIVDRHRPDLLVSMSCPQIIGRQVRRRFDLGCINVHGAPLPRYRGLMPSFWVLRHGEAATAATVHDLGDRLDNGAILRQRRVAIDPADTWDSLVRKTKAAGARALLEAMDEIEAGTVRRRPNADAGATYFSFPTARDRRAFARRGRRFFGGARPCQSDAA